MSFAFIDVCITRVLYLQMPKETCSYNVILSPMWRGPSALQGGRLRAGPVVLRLQKYTFLLQGQHEIGSHHPWQVAQNCHYSSRASMTSSGTSCSLSLSLLFLSLPFTYTHTYLKVKILKEVDLLSILLCRSGCP